MKKDKTAWILVLATRLFVPPGPRITATEERPARRRTRLANFASYGVDCPEFCRVRGA
jgi:hypothetical protein